MGGVPTVRVGCDQASCLFPPNVLAGQHLDWMPTANLYVTTLSSYSSRYNRYSSYFFVLFAITLSSYQIFILEISLKVCKHKT